MIATPIYADRPSPSSASAAIQGEQRTLHALNRLTFGPRPGEIAEVDRSGLKRWFEAQLHPESIDDSALDARLSAYPAMSLPQRELIERYPSPQALRATIQRNDPLPRDPVEHAIYADGIAFYKETQARKAASQAALNASPGADDTAMSVQQGSVKVPPSAAAAATAEDTEAAPPAPKRDGQARHDESAFPEALTLEILALSPDVRVRRLLALEPAQLVSFRRSLSQAEVANVARDLTPAQKEIVAALQGSARMIGAEVLASRLERDVYSRREVEAVMTDFWLNHFNVYLRKNQNELYLLPAYERETIRPHVFGRFEDLLVATAKSPAMLMYLDNWQSIGPDSEAAHRGQGLANFARKPQGVQSLKDRGLNENYARELMELHTLGVGCEVSQDHTVAQLDPACGGGYTQADVTEVAKVFSGWTIDRPAQGGDYKFEQRRHQPGKKLVLGQTISENGEKEGLEVLHMLAMSPATARFLSTGIAVRFVSDTPPPALVDRMTKSYLASGGEIRSVLRTMFDSPEFWSPTVYRVKVKTPLEFVTSALRSTDASVTNAIPLVQALDRLGMPLYGMQTPNGYSSMSAPWVSTGALVSRMNFALVLSSNRLPGTHTELFAASSLPSRPVSPQTASAARPAAAIAIEEQQLETILLGTPVSDRTRRAVLAQADDGAIPQQAEQSFLHGSLNASPHSSLNPWKDAGAASPADPFLNQRTATMAGLLLGSPEFQRR